MRDPFPSYCSGKLSSKDKRNLSTKPAGTVITVECPKCRGSVDGFVTPLGDAQIRRHFPPAVLKRSAAIKAETAAEDEDD
jgi:hypothetical protein